MYREYIPMTGPARSALIGLSMVWMLCATVVFFRLLGRYRGSRIWFDDILSAIALCFSAASVSMNVAFFVSGVGYNYDPALPVYPKLERNMEFIMKLTFIFTVLYAWALGASKLSQLCFYLRVFSIKLKWWIYAVGAIVIACALIFTFLSIFLCHPIKQQWMTDRVGHCMDQIVVSKGLVMTNVVTDLFIVILPISTVWNLQMRRTEKLAIISCFALGLACCIIGIVRFWQLSVVKISENMTGTSLTTYTLCTLDLLLAGLCINIPMLQPFYLRFRSKYKNSQLSGTNGQESSRNPREGQQDHQQQQQHPRLRPNRGDYSAWIELNDKDHEAASNDDGSERKLTRTPPVPEIRVSTKWSVTRE